MPYFAAIAALVRSQSVYVIAALGSDYYATYQQFPELVALTKPSGRFDLQPPTRAELGKMIRSPAEASGLQFERQPKTGQALDDALIDAALASADQLPLLEHLLFMLYRKQAEREDGLLRWSDYTELGELDGALAHHAEKVFTKLSSDARQAFDFVMRRLAPIESGRKASGRMALYRDLVSSPELDSRLRAGARKSCGLHGQGRPFFLRNGFQAGSHFQRRSSGAFSEMAEVSRMVDWRIKSSCECEIAWTVVSSYGSSEAVKHTTF